MNIKSTAQYWFIIIKNPVKEKVNVERLFRKDSGYTTKSETRHHGIGTYNIKHTVESNGGILRAHCTEKEFTLGIMIYKTT